MVRRTSVLGVLASLLASAVLIAPTAAVRPVAAASGPVAEWKFDEGSGTTASDAVGNLDGTISGGASWVASDAAQGTGALAFDGVDDVVTVANDAVLEPSGAFTVGLWVRSTNPGSLSPLVSKGHWTCGYGAAWGVAATNFGPTGYAHLVTWDGWLPTSESGQSYWWWDDAWHLLTYTVDPAAKSSRLTMDGHEWTTDWPGPDSVDYDDPELVDDVLRFGDLGDSCLTKFQGTLDDIRIWNRGLTHAEILAMLPSFATTTDLHMCVDGACGTETITSAYLDQPLVFSVRVSPWPASPGDITWYRSTDGGPEEVFATRPLIVVDNTGVDYFFVPTGTFPVGTYTIRASWPGADNWQPSSSPALPLEILRRPLNMEASLTPSAVLPGEAATLTARISVDNPPLTYLVTGSVDVYETTGGSEQLIGSGTLAYTGDPHWNTAAINVPGISAGAHDYEARYGGTSTLAPATAAVSITAGRQLSWVAIWLSPNPVLNTQHATADITLGTFRQGSDPTGGLPDPTGTLTLKTAPGGIVVGTTPVVGTGVYHMELPILPAGNPQFTVEYSGDLNFEGYTTAPATLAVQTDVVEVTGVGVQYSTFYPYKDGYRDTVAIRGTRLEPASVAISIYNANGKRVRTASVGMASGAWSWAWTGRNASGTLQPAGKYRVVQVITDAAGVRASVTSYTNLSNKRLYTHTVTITKRYTKAARKTSSWLAWSFTLPSATVYKSLKFSIYGKDNLGSGGFGPHDYSYCPSAIWHPICVTRWKPFPTTYSWKSVTGSVTRDRSGRSVRLYAWGGAGHTRITYGRVKVTYGILK